MIDFIYLALRTMSRGREREREREMPCVTPCSCLLFSFPPALICKESEMTVCWRLQSRLSKQKGKEVV